MVGRILWLTLLLVLLTGLAQAQEFTPPGMSDPLATRLLCQSSPEWSHDGRSFSWASIFSLPEPGGGERLYVGYVDDLLDAAVQGKLWRGPVATRWKGLRAVPGHRSSLRANNDRRYLLDRQDALPGGRLQTKVLELDLDANPPLLHTLEGGTGKLVRQESAPLGEPVPMNEALLLVTRMELKAAKDSGAYRLRAYDIIRGDAPSRSLEQRLKPIHWPDAPYAPFLLAVCATDGSEQASMHFLPPEKWGWEFERVLATPERTAGNGRFLVRLISKYWGRSAKGEEFSMGRRWLVGVGLEGGMTRRVVQEGLYFDPERGLWSPVDSPRQGKGGQK